MKVGHHGSKVAITSQEAAVMKPELSIASAGAYNTYGHPSEEIIDVLEDLGSVFLCTIQKGDVHVMPGRNGVMVQGSLG